MDKKIKTMTNNAQETPSDRKILNRDPWEIPITDEDPTLPLDRASDQGVLDSDTWHRRIEDFIYCLIEIFILWLIAQFFRWFFGW